MKGKINLKVLITIVLSVCFPLTESQTCQRPPEKCIDLTKVNCANIKYRKMDGSCNNPINPTLGMAFTSYRRLLPVRYSDRIYAPPVARSGNPLPSARLLSFRVFGRASVPDPNLSMMSMAWGQAVIHDTSNRISSRSTQLIRPLDVKPRTCCSAQRQFEVQNTNVPCLPIVVPPGDPFFANSQCLTFDRTITEKDQKCPGTADPVPAEQLTGVTHYLDLSFVYGNSDAQSRSLRKLTGGLLLTSDAAQMWPPRSPTSITNQTTNDPYAPFDPTGITYIFGDGRGNQNPGLTLVHITLLREHNRIARKLAEYNPHWDDEKLFQEARRINIAQYQHITYYEWIVNFVGALRSQQQGLTFNVAPQQFVNNYNPCADPRSTQAFQHSAFRFFHTHIAGTFNLASESRQVYNSSILLSTVLGRSGILEQGCPFSPRERGCQYKSFLRGLSSQAAGRFDTEIDPELAENFPIELRSFDLQRDRDHGIASYNDFRTFCGQPRATRWEDYGNLISAANINKLKTIYESHEDVDLSIGAALETPLPAGVLGPTFTCIITKQFLALRTGDRYFFEYGNQPYPFTPAQLAEIRKDSSARVLCDNANVFTMQPAAFKKISASNPLRACATLPRPNLQLWKE